VLVGRGTAVVLILFLCWSSDVTALFGSSFSLLYSWIDMLSTVIQEEEVLSLPISDRTTGAGCEKPRMMLTIALLLLVL
jgi:hypothetical protein